MLMKSNGYINASKLCSDSNVKLKKTKKKEISHWLENDKSQGIINALVDSLGKPRESLLIKIADGKNLTRGTYVHPKLIIHIAAWCDPTYALQVSDIVIKYHAREAIEKKERLIQHKNKLLKKKEDKIDKLTHMVKEVLSKNNEISKNTVSILKENKKITKVNTQLTANTDKLLNDNKKLKNKADKLIKDNKITRGQLNTIEGQMSRCLPKRVIDPEDTSLNHTLVVIRNNNEDVDSLYDYTILRTQKKSIKSAFNKHSHKYVDAEIILQLSYTPNSINLYNRIKEYLKNKITGKINSFDLNEDYEEEDLLRDIKYLHKQRFDRETL